MKKWTKYKKIMWWVYFPVLLMSCVKGNNVFDFVNNNIVENKKSIPKLDSLEEQIKQLEKQKNDWTNDHEAMLKVDASWGKYLSQEDLDEWKNQGFPIYYQREIFNLNFLIIELKIKLLENKNQNYEKLKNWTNDDLESLKILVEEGLKNLENLINFPKQHGFKIEDNVLLNVEHQKFLKNQKELEDYQKMIKEISNK